MTTRGPLNILVVGAGALGSLFGAKLAAIGRSITFLQRGTEKVRVINDRGLQLREGGKETVFRIPAYTKDSLPKTRKFDWVLLMTKAYDTEEGISDANPWVGRDTRVLTLQNGIGPVDILAQAVGPERVAAGTTSEGSLLLAPGEAVHTGSGETVVGALSKGGSRAIEELSDTLNEAGFRTRNVSDISPHLYGKALVNAVINPITALTGMRNGGILECEPAKRLASEIASECAGILAAMGVTLPYEDPLERVLEVARNTAENRSSMLQDVENRRKTEVEYISGAFVREAIKRGLAAPLNAALRELLLSREWARPSHP